MDPRRVVLAQALALAACHVTSSDVITRPGNVQRISHPEGQTTRPPVLTLTDATFQFVEPRECLTEDIVTSQRAREVTRGPNLATFVVGVIATSVGAVLLVRGLTEKDTSNPLAFGGGALLAVGLPFAIGPWIGNRRELTPLGETSRRQPGPATRCGEQPLATASAATLAVRGIEVFGRIDPRGTFAVSPFAFVDAFEPGSAAWSVAARIDARTTDVMIDGQALAAAAAIFLRTADFDTKVEPMRLVPNLVPGKLRVTLTGEGVRIAVAIRNDGLGDTYHLRGHITAPGTPALDGRIIYFGHIAKAMTLERALEIPIAPGTLAALGTVELSVELRDAHGTAPRTPMRFRGKLR